MCRCEVVSVSYLWDPGLVGRAALQVFQDAGEGVDLGVQTGASLLQGLLWCFHLGANITHMCNTAEEITKTACNDTPTTSTPMAQPELYPGRGRL